MDNKDQAAWEEYCKTLEKPEEMYIGWQNTKGTHFTICSAAAEKAPPAANRWKPYLVFQVSVMEGSQPRLVSQERVGQVACSVLREEGLATLCCGGRAERQ